MANLLDSVWEYAKHENITPKQVAALLLMMVSNDERDYTVSNICKEITPNVIFRSIKRGLRTSSWSFLIHFLSLGRGFFQMILFTESLIYTINLRAEQGKLCI